jgi:hypothetical protein
MASPATAVAASQLPLTSTYFRLCFTHQALGPQTLERYFFPQLQRYSQNPWLQKKKRLVRGIQIDMERLRWLGSSEAAWLALGIDAIRNRVGGQIGLILPADESAIAFLNRWDFLELPCFKSGSVFVDARSLARYHASGTHYRRVAGMSSRLLELTSVPTILDEEQESVSFTKLLTRIQLVLRKQLSWESRKGLVSTFCNVFLLELLNNISEHSKSEFGVVAIRANERGLPCGDYFDWEQHFITQNPRYVELFIGDSGIGIVDTLREAFERAGHTGDDDAVLKYACEKGTTSKPDASAGNLAPRRGMGLFYVAERVKEWQGAFELRSGGGLVCFAHDHNRGWVGYEKPLGEQQPAFFAGTQVRILLPIDVATGVLDRLSSPL